MSHDEIRPFTDDELDSLNTGTLEAPSRDKTIEALHAEVERLTHETTLREDRLREQVKELQQEITSLTSDNTSPAQEEIECDHNWVPTVGRSCTKCPEGFSHSVTEAETSIERIADLGLKLSLLREEVSDCLHRTYHYAPETHGNTLAAFSGTYEQVAMECERLRDEVERLKEELRQVRDQGDERCPECGEWLAAFHGLWEGKWYCPKNYSTAAAENIRLREALERIANEDQTTQWHNAWDIARAALEGKP